MKMKNILSFSLLFILLSCNQKDTPKCNSEEVKNTVFEIIKEQKLNTIIEGTYKEEIRAKLDSLSLELIRTESIDENLQKCNCEAVLKGLPLNYIEKKALGFNEFDLKDEEINIKYEVQTNEERETIITVEPFSNIE